MKTSENNKNINTSLKMAERLQTYLFTWAVAEKREDTVHLIEMAIDATNKIIENLNKSTEANNEQQNNPHMR